MESKPEKEAKPFEGIDEQLKSNRGSTQRNWVEREGGGEIGMRNTCNSMADSCQCMTKPTEML